jgi:16S rRNA (cytidine1402-2'-O)-methyltransferase
VKPGTLFVIATPLGNLSDISARALETLRSVQRVICEDTRLTARLLGRYGIETPRVSCHRFNERERVEALLGELREGADLALVSDGGTPSVSDPGALLVSAALDAGVRVTPVPGPCAATALLSVGGLPSDRFVFEGFLPHRGGERRRRLRELRDEPRTLVLYEAPHRIRETLEDVEAILGERLVVLGREMTKVHETIIRGSARQILDRMGPGEVRGECTLLVSGPSHDDRHRDATDSTESAALLTTWRQCLAEAGGDRREALRSAARRLGLRRAELWRKIQELSGTGP